MLNSDGRLGAFVITSNTSRPGTLLLFVKTGLFFFLPFPTGPSLSHSYLITLSFSFFFSLSLSLFLFLCLSVSLSLSFSPLTHFHAKAIDRAAQGVEQVIISGGDSGPVVSRTSHCSVPFLSLPSTTPFLFRDSFISTSYLDTSGSTSCQYLPWLSHSSRLFAVPRPIARSRPW